MKVEIRKAKLTEIKPNPNNPRVLKDEAFKKLCESIKNFPEMTELREIVVDENNMILGGNQRYRAMKDMKVKECILKQVTGLSEAKKQEFIIKDNAPEGISGEWDYDILANEWNADELQDWGVDFPKMLEIRPVVVNSDMMVLGGNMR